MCVSRISCFRGRIIKGHFEVSGETTTPVDLCFCSIVAMEKVDTAYNVSDGAMKMLFNKYEIAKDEFNRAKDVLRKANNQIHEGFEELREDQDALAAKNGMLDVNVSEILDINVGGVIISVTRYTLTLIKGTRLEALFSGRWDKRLKRNEGGRMFLDVNPNCFGEVVNLLRKRQITLPEYSLKFSY